MQTVWVFISCNQARHEHADFEEHAQPESMVKNITQHKHLKKGWQYMLLSVAQTYRKRRPTVK